MKFRSEGGIRELRRSELLRDASLRDRVRRDRREGGRDLNVFFCRRVFFGSGVENRRNNEGAKIFVGKIVNGRTCEGNVDSGNFRRCAGNLRKPRETKGAVVSDKREVVSRGRTFAWTGCGRLSGVLDRILGLKEPISKTDQM